MDDLFRALPALLKALDDNETVREAVAFAAWRRIAGESLRQHAVPVALKQKRLTVAVKSETWRKHLEQLAGQMVFKLNASLGQAVVTFIEFKVDEDAVLRARSAETDAKMSDEEYQNEAIDEVTPTMRKAADAIKDDNLRYQFLLAAGGCLARKKRMGKIVNN